MSNAATLLQHAILKNINTGAKYNNYSQRPLVDQAVTRIKKINTLLSSAENLDDAVFSIDSDLLNRDLDAEIAKYVYRAQLLRSDDNVPRPLTSTIKMPASAQAVDFYVALHVMRSLSRNFEATPELLLPLSHVHTHRVNCYCKLLINSIKRQNNISTFISRILAAYNTNIKSIQPQARTNLQAHLCYLIGRVDDNQSRPLAVELLKRWRDHLISPNEKKRSPPSKKASTTSKATLERLNREQLLLYRTIQISLIHLETPEESDRYILSCMTSPRLDAQNRGFHLEYYGDIPYDLAQPLSNVDMLSPFPRTLRILGDKLIDPSESAAREPLRDIQLYTVISLLRSRLQCGVLAEEDRRVGHGILMKAAWKSSDQRLQMLLKRVRSDLENPSFHPAGIVREIFKLKKLPRTGWINKGRRVSTPESVGSHTFGGMTLIELFLPETKSPEAQAIGKGYSKEKVLRLFLKHDWAEAIIGDLLPEQKNEEAAAREESEFRTLGLAYIYTPYANRSIYEDWAEFEHEATVNAQLARDVDRLDNLLQLLIEMDHEIGSIPDGQSWIKDIEQKLRTEWGKEMMKFLLLAAPKLDSRKVV